MDQQRGRPVLVEFWDFCRVNSLRTLPYLRAWHERYADAGLRVDRRAHRRLRAGARSGQRARGGRAARGPVSGRDRRAARDLGPLRQRGLAGPLPVGPGRRRCTRCTTARAPTRRPSARSRSCSASSASRWRRCARRTRRARGCPAQTADQPGAYSRPVRGRRRVGRRRRRGRAARATGARSRSPGRAAWRSSSTREHTAGVLELEVGAGRRRAWPPASRRGWRQLRVPRSPSSRDEPRRRRRPRPGPPCPASRATRSACRRGSARW